MVVNQYARKLIEKTKNLPTQIVKIKIFKNNLKRCIWSGKLSPYKIFYNPIKNKYFYYHLKKILDADLKYPIICKKLSGRILILDGYHRLAKAYYLNKDKEIKVKWMN